MPTNVPPVTFTDRGFQAPTDAAILAGRQQDYQDAFGGNLNFSTTDGSPVNATPQGQLTTTDTAIIAAADAVFVAITNGVDPAYAEGRMQDAIGRIYFIERKPALPTIVTCTCLGKSGTVIPGGTVGTPPAVMAVDTSGNQYVCVQGGTIPLAGTLTLQFANVIPGPTPCPEGSLTKIYQTIPGWDSITNPDDGVLGNNTESRTQFEVRRAATVAKNSFGAIGSIVGQVADLPDVLDYFGYSNYSGSPVTVFGVAIAAHSIFISVEGGAQSDIAQAILSKLSPGCGMVGNTTVTAYDNNPLYSSPIPYSIIFEIPTALPILFAVNIANGADVPADAATQIQDAVLNAFAGADGGTRARIASKIYASRFYAPIAALGPWVRIISIQIGSTNAPAATFTGSISGTTLTVVSVASGAVAIGQTLFDAAGHLIEGTTILSGSGTTWTVSASQTVTSETMLGVVANLNDLQVQGNQVPTTAAPLITVTLT